MTHSFFFKLPLVVPALIVGMFAHSTLPAADPAAEQYTKVVSAEPDLAAYWRFDGDLKDAKGNFDAQAEGGRPQFGEGPGGGKALVLEQGRFGTMGNAPQLDLKETTVELWFRPDFKPGLPYNPCIIAKRADGDHRNTRFSIHGRPFAPWTVALPGRHLHGTTDADVRRRGALPADEFARSI